MTGVMMRKVIRLATRALCAWCGKVLSDDGRGGPDTHGICKDCAKKMG